MSFLTSEIERERKKKIKKKVDKNEMEKFFIKSQKGGGGKEDREKRTCSVERKRRQKGYFDL